MKTADWKLWIAPGLLWVVYSCWHFGYQSGYTDGHDTAWKMYRQPNLEVAVQDYPSDRAESFLAAESDDSLRDLPQQLEASESLAAEVR